MYIKSLIVIVIFGIIGLTEIVPLAQQKKRKELVIYSILFASTFVLSMLYSLGVELPQISIGINAIIDTIFQTKLS